MGGVAVLHPQELFNNNNHNSLKIFSPAMKSHYLRPNTNPNPNRRKRSPRKTTVSPLKGTKPTNTNLVIGQVKILKRGEDLPPPVNITAPSQISKDELVQQQKKQPHKLPKITTTKKNIAPVDHGLVFLSSNDRLGLEPDLLPKQVPISALYAGSAMIPSPPPSSLPLPAFYKKKNRILADVGSNNSSSSNHEATSDLLRLLRLDLS